MAKPTYYFACFVHRLITTKCYIVVAERCPSEAKFKSWGADFDGAQSINIEKVSHDTVGMLTALKESPGHSVQRLKTYSVKVGP